MLLNEKIEEVLMPVAGQHKMVIVEVSFLRGMLQILVEKEDGTPPTVGDCEQVSHAMSVILDVEDLIKSKYFLEVGSAGIDRPLTRLADFNRFVGRDVKAELKMPRNSDDNRLRFKGKILKIEGDIITLSVNLDGKEQDIQFEFANVSKAKLLITDEDIKEILRNNKKERKS